MLAREMKIKTIKQQREFIKAALSAYRKDGNPSYSYVGQVYPEVVHYFEKEGYFVTKLNFEGLLVRTAGQPVYRFTISDFHLTDDEFKEAEDYKPENTPDNLSFEDFLKELVSEAED